MNKNWLHPNRPNVPQPPYNLSTQIDVPPTDAPSRLRRQKSLGTAGDPGGSLNAYAQGRAADAPPVPRVPTNYASPHHNAYHTAGGAPSTPESQPMVRSPQATSSSASEPTPRNEAMRRMTAEQRAAYIREVDARQAGRAPAESGLRPLQLTQTTLQVRRDVAPEATASTSSSAAAPLPADDEELRQYLDGLYQQAEGTESEPVAAPDTPTDVGEHDDEMPTASSGSAPAPAGLDVPTEALPTPPTTPTYATTANPDGRHRVAPTATYDLGHGEAGHGRSASVTVTPTAPGAAVGPVRVDAANNAVVEIFSNGQVVARISLPYPGAGRA